MSYQLNIGLKGPTGVSWFLNLGIALRELHYSYPGQAFTTFLDRSGEEPTLVVKLPNTIIMRDVASLCWRICDHTQQDCIAAAMVFDGTVSAGSLFGPMKGNWEPFDAAKFITYKEFP